MTFSLKRRRFTEISKGYTLVELLIAFGVFSLFFGGLFSLYRMSMKMFVPVLWKKKKKKEAQLFLSILKERLEQASRPSRVTATNPFTDQGNASVWAFPANPNNAGTIATSGPFTLAGNVGNEILSFSICKPDLTSVGGNQGLWYGQTLSIYNCGTNPPTYGLQITGTTNTAGFSNPPTFPGGWSGGGTLAQYQLGSFQTLKLSEVTSVTVRWDLASGTTGLEAGGGGKVWSVTVKMQHPSGLFQKNELTQNVQAKIDSDVPIQGQAAPF
ncbi:prepilin-type N-terminal cleavage/methylation domain-containing protein [bacterium]|nr:prepilin-type N-terminal cleavage/methylation domain-containing protein [bacterium]